MSLSAPVPDFLGRVIGRDGHPQGTCFQVDVGVFVTAWHVLAEIGASHEGGVVDIEPLSQPVGDGRIKATVARLGPDHDLAVLIADGGGHLLASVPGFMWTDRIRRGAALVVTGVARLDILDRTLRYMDAPGSWAGTAVGDVLPWGQLTCNGVVPGMSGAPVLLEPTNVVAGVVSGRLNTADQWVRDRVWVARVEDLAPLLDGIVEVERLLISDVRSMTADHHSWSAPQHHIAFPIHNLPLRNRLFVGREDVLSAIRSGLIDGQTTVVQALRGMGGVGKTQAVTEYAHRYVNEYDVAWWINAERVDLVGDQLSGLAHSLGLVKPGTDNITAMSMLIGWFSSQNRWLLVFDNAGVPSKIRPWIPSGSGHVLITSRHRQWGELAHSVDVGLMAPHESIALLQAHGSLLTTDASMLATELGNLPLALVQAAGFMETTRTSLTEYLAMLRARPETALLSSPSASYQLSLPAMISIARDRLKAANPGAAHLLEICALLSPDPIPLWLFAQPYSAETVEANIAMREAIGVLQNYGLVPAVESSIQLHRLFRSIVLDQMAEPTKHKALLSIYDLMVTAHPGSASHSDTWLKWGSLLPHILTVDAVASSNLAYREMACDAAFYLISRGEPRRAEELARKLTEGLTEAVGLDDPSTTRAKHNLAMAWRHLGLISEALRLDRENYERRRSLLGQDHPETLKSANSLGNDLRELGRPEEAVVIETDTYQRRRRLLGEDNIDTMNSAHNLAGTLRELGDLQEARRLNEDTLQRRQRMFGLEHPHTLHSMDNLGSDYVALGMLDEARYLLTAAFTGRERVLGRDHKDTMESGSHLARALMRLGQTSAAQALNNEILERRRRVLGDAHYDTARSRRNLDANRTYREFDNLHQDDSAGTSQ